MLFSDFLSLRYPEPSRNSQDFDSSFTDIHSHFLPGLNHFPSPIFFGGFNDFQYFVTYICLGHKKENNFGIQPRKSIDFELKKNHFTECHEMVQSLRSLCVNYFEVWEVIYRKATETKKGRIEEENTIKVGRAHVDSFFRV